MSTADLSTLLFLEWLENNLSNTEFSGLKVLEVV